ncbi:MAG TPA: hypothetical protein VEQ10_02270 [Vicinamibacteria bacterium]|nr:hypothetical protein [Vicinamibacteria bacterium]
MKLKPPASSSDVEIAREIARRLHQHRRREDRPVAVGASTPQAEPQAPPPVALPRPPVAPPVEAARPAVVEPPPPLEEPKPPLPVEPPPPSFHEPAPPRFEPPAKPLPEPVAEPEPAPDYGAPEATPSAPVPEDPPPPPPPATPAELPRTQAAAPAVTEEVEVPVSTGVLDEPAPPSWDEPPAAQASDTADDVLDALASVPPPDVDAVPAAATGGTGMSVDVEEAESPAGGAPPAPQESAPEEELFDTPSPPSWDEIAENCMRMAGAHGAMLVDPRGQVFAARGDWPEPGPDAIAGRLVAMMDRALRDAPTRSVSAPVAGMHLTAWRIPTPGGLITTALVADEPVRAELRHVVDTEIHRAAGS